MALVLGLVAGAGAVGCFAKSDATGSADSEVVEASDVLKSTLVLEDGCTAAKVGPRHLVLAARCVADKPAFAPGKVIKFKRASLLKSIIIKDTQAKDGGAVKPPPADKDAGGPVDAGPAPTATDAGNGTGTETEDAGKPTPETKDGGIAPTPPTKPANTSETEATIASVEINPSYTSKCKDNACTFGSVAAADTKDIAVIVLDADLEAVKTIPIDLDKVGAGQPVLSIGSGCAKIDGTPTGLKAVKTIAVPAKSAKHQGSVFVGQNANLVGGLDGQYVVTPGQAWKGKDAPLLCSVDIGAPLFRAGDVPAVAGVTSNFTMWEPGKPTPVTIHHTRVDGSVGEWLTGLGVTTVKSCNGTCAKSAYDGGEPIPTSGGTTEPGDGGRGDAAAPADGGGGDAGGSTTEPEGEDEFEPRFPGEGSSDDDFGSSNDAEDEEEATDAGAKKKKAASSGCSASPGTLPPGTGGILFGVGLGIFALVARRRQLKNDAE